MTVTLAAIAALAVGYFVARVRPWARLAAWADWRLRGHDRLRSGRNYRQAAVAVAFLATHPRGAWNAWRHSNDSAPELGPAPAFDPNWAAKRHWPPAND